MKSPIETFHQWSLNGRDEGMEEGHANSVDEMLNFILNNNKKPFSFIYAGCGNGWVVRKVLSNSSCQSATGIDGATGMIDKALRIDPKGNYICADLISWKPDRPVDIVLSMEGFYYFSNPKNLVKHIFDHWLKPNGSLIAGVDYYKENKPSLSWQKDCGISTMTLLHSKEWISIFKRSGFKNIKSWQYGKKDSWSGTLIVTGKK